MNKGDLVVYTCPMKDEVDMVYKVLEVNGDRVLIEAQNGMAILPTTVALVIDLSVLEDGE